MVHPRLILPLRVIILFCLTIFFRAFVLFPSDANTESVVKYGQQSGKYDKVTNGNSSQWKSGFGWNHFASLSDLSALTMYFLSFLSFLFFSFFSFPFFSFLFFSF